MRAPALFVLDVVLVLVFALVGRRSHEETSALLGILGTAGPFLAGLLVGWGASLARGVRPLTVRTGVPLLLVTVAVGHLVRVLTGGTTAVSFILVSLVALGIFLLLPRAIAERTRAARP